MKGLTRIRQAKGLSQRTLAKRINVSAQSINNYEKSRGKATLPNILKLIKELECTFEELMSENELVLVIEPKYVTLKNRNFITQENYDV